MKHGEAGCFLANQQKTGSAGSLVGCLLGQLYQRPRATDLLVRGLGSEEAKTVTNPLLARPLKSGWSWLVIVFGVRGGSCRLIWIMDDDCTVIIMYSL